jgi:3-deoxy-D-manno-octulosonate 8-phosphate phosphatase (KDO 8-P phosphatase)
MATQKGIPRNVLNRAKKIRVILMDVDGVMTRGDIVYDSNGLEIKHFNAHDGLGIKLARLAGLKTGIISSRESGTIRVRAAELKMDHLYLGRDDKLRAFQELQGIVKLPMEEFCFIGDDLPDIPVLQAVGLGIAVKNASELTKKNAHFVTHGRGGEGAVREVVEIILNARGLMDETIKKLWH